MSFTCLNLPLDLLSYCTRCQMFGQEWQKEHLLSLGGVGAMKSRTFP